MKQEKLEAILETARKKFGKYGIQKTSLHEIAGTAKVAKATIYNYFKSKDEVYLAVLNREVNEVIASISAVVEKATSPVDKLKSFMHAKLHYMKAAINILNLDREGVDSLLPKTGNIRDRFFAKEVNILRAILAKGVDEGIFCVSNIMLTAQAIAYALRGFETTWLLREIDSEIEIYLENLSDVLCKGLLVREVTT